MLISYVGFLNGRKMIQCSSKFDGQLMIFPVKLAKICEYISACSDSSPYHYSWLDPKNPPCLAKSPLVTVIYIYTYM